MVDVEKHIGLVYEVAKKYDCRYLDKEDIIGYGMIGLVEAARKFDETRGIKFSSYACPYIAGYIKRGLSNNSNTIGTMQMRNTFKAEPFIYIEDLVAEGGYEDTLSINQLMVGDFSSNSINDMEIEFCLQKLKKSEREIVIDHFFNEKSLADIAREKGVTRQAIWNTMSVVKKKLKPLFERHLIA